MTTTAFKGGQSPSPLAVFRNRNFTLLWLADAISDFGSGITAIAASILVYRLTGSALSVGLMLMVTALPGLFFGLIAGVFVDRWDRKRIMVASEMLRTVLILLIPVLLPYGIWWLYIMVMLTATIDQFFEPAHASVLPDIASDEELAAANSYLSASAMGAMGLGFAVAGLITGRFSPEWAFYLDALTFLLSGLIIWRVTVPPLQVEEGGSIDNILKNLQEGRRFLLASPPLRSLLPIMAAIALLFGFHNSLLLPFAERALNASEFQYGLMEGISLIGFVLGSLWMAVVADRLREGQWLAMSFIGMGLMAIFYSQLDSVPLAIVVGTVMTFVNVPSFIARRLLVQRNTTREVRGRVSSVFFVIRDFLFVVGMGAAGLADLYDIRLLVLIEGALLAVVGFVVLVLPGLGQPAAEWRRAISLLRGATTAPGIGLGRTATLADLDLLATRLPAFATLQTAERQRLVAEMRYLQAEPGTVIVRQDEESDAAYFLLEGSTVAGRQEDGSERILEKHSPGDFFGEIAALTGVPRTANVVVEEAATLLKVPATALRQMAADANLNRAFMSKMTERMVRMNMLDIPRMVGPDQDLMRDLRRREPQPATA